jgi:hypothetical protein
VSEPVERKREKRVRLKRHHEPVGLANEREFQEDYGEQ